MWTPLVFLLLFSLVCTFAAGVSAAAFSAPLTGGGGARGGAPPALPFLVLNPFGGGGGAGGGPPFVLLGRSGVPFAGRGGGTGFPTGVASPAAYNWSRGSMGGGGGGGPEAAAVSDTPASVTCKRHTNAILVP
jgi:hypothetical protein